jgi:hypothetical protein
VNLLNIAKAVATIAPNHSILIYGPPKSGKTRLAATAAKIPEVERIFWFDLENGVETLLGMGFTEEEMAKITVIKIADTRDNPIGIETMLKALTSKVPVKICEAHGKVNCAECTKENKPSITFSLKDCTHNDLIVIDSGSQLGDSALGAACLGKEGMYKPTFDEYGMVNKWLGDICSVIQQCANSNFVVLTHEIALEDDEKKDRFFPLMGSKPFSMKCAKYFGTVVYVHKKLNKHVAGSSSTYLGDRLTGSRVNAMIEKNPEKADMRTILIDGGILKAGAHSRTIESVVDKMVAGIPQQLKVEIPQKAVVHSTVQAQPAVKLTLAERIALKNQTTK